jgi:hypothetical protein
MFIICWGLHVNQAMKSYVFPCFHIVYTYESLAGNECMFTCVMSCVLNIPTFDVNTEPMPVSLWNTCNHALVSSCISFVPLYQSCGTRARINDHSLGFACQLSHEVICVSMLHMAYTYELLAGNECMFTCVMSCVLNISTFDTNTEPMLVSLWNTCNHALVSSCISFVPLHQSCGTRARINDHFLGFARQPSHEVICVSMFHMIYTYESLAGNKCIFTCVMSCVLNIPTFDVNTKPMLVSLWNTCNHALVSSCISFVPLY